MNRTMKAIAAVMLMSVACLTTGCTPEIWDPVETTTDAPKGAVKGLFSVSEDQQVWFSQGNLQYIGSAGTPYWRFADYQWDYLGLTTGQDSDSPDVNRDLFGWATSGCYTGGIYYMPYDVNTTTVNYGPGYYNLTDNYANADWGVFNAISNGGNTPDQWRTLSQAEWEYVLSRRSTTSGILFAKAVVNGVNGIIVLPDKWSQSTFSLASTNDKQASFSSNTISSIDWTEVLEPKGAVFLPASGIRKGTNVESLGENGLYWSTTYGTSGQARGLSFSDSYMNISNSYSTETSRGNGASVRLVQEYHPGWPTVTTSEVTEIAQTSAKGSGNVTSAGSNAVIEQGVCWSTSHNPTTSDSYAACSLPGSGSFTVNMTGLTPNTTYYVRAYATNKLGTSYGQEMVFTTLPSANAPEGAVNGLFSVSETQQVWFSKGNLQYIGSETPAYWKFAECQWDRFGVSTGQDSDATDADRDLFGWATSGCYSGTSGTNYYMPYDVNTTSAYYGPGYNNLTGQYAEADWGVYNAISNGGNTPGQWRTLSQIEWEYLLSKRKTPSNALFAKAVVNDVNGVMILPDDWVSSAFILASINDKGASYNSNTVSAEEWTSIMEPKGVVFLPASGIRKGTTIESLGENGLYWSTTYGSSAQARGLSFSDSNLYNLNTYSAETNRSYGACVRLVQEY